DVRPDQIQVWLEQSCRVRFETRCPRVGQDQAIYAAALNGRVHAAPYPYLLPVARCQIPDTRCLQPGAIVEVEHPLLPERQPGVHRDPLNPRLECWKALPCISDRDQRLIPQALEIGQLTTADEPFDE